MVKRGMWRCASRLWDPCIDVPRTGRTAGAVLMYVSTLDTLRILPLPLPLEAARDPLRPSSP